jgi:hypothetical protein
LLKPGKTKTSPESSEKGGKKANEREGVWYELSQFIDERK